MANDIYHNVSQQWGIGAAKVVDFAATFIASGGTVPAAKVVEFMMVCDAHKLNPATKEVAAFYSPNKGLTTFVMIDGWVKMANQHPQCDGWSFEERFDANGKIEAVRCLMRRKDRSAPVVTPWLHLKEWSTGQGQWLSRPSWMLSMKALKHGARLAFGFAGLYDNEEAEEIHDAPGGTKQTEVVVLEPAMKQSKSKTIGASITFEKTGEVDAVEPQPEAVAVGSTATAASPEPSPVDDEPPLTAEQKTQTYWDLFGSRLNILLDEAGLDLVKAAKVVKLKVSELKEIVAGKAEPLSFAQVKALGNLKEDPILEQELLDLMDHYTK